MIAQDQLDNFAAAIINDYNNIGSGNKKVQIVFEEGKKYIRVIFSSGYCDDYISRSAHSFIEIDTGNIWKAASWKAPAKNKPRGHIDTLTPNVICWTGAK